MKRIATRAPTMGRPMSRLRSEGHSSAVALAIAASLGLAGLVARGLWYREDQDEGA